MSEADLSEEEMTAVEAEQLAELRRRSERFRSGREPIPSAGRTAVIIDDGVATGATAKVACQAVRAHGASRVVLAVPIGADDTVKRFAGYASGRCRAEGGVAQRASLFSPGRGERLNTRAGGPTTPLSASIHLQHHILIG